MTLYINSCLRFSCGNHKEQPGARSWSARTHHRMEWNLDLHQYRKDAKGISLRRRAQRGDHHSLIFTLAARNCVLAYCNSGPWVAGYVVEKITGQGFEVVTKNFFLPIGMKLVTYFATASATAELSPSLGRQDVVCLSGTSWIISSRASPMPLPKTWRLIFSFT